ncbi:hypothetical protein [Streptomyces sp. V3I8]|uniref:hypothetical protein n=1 Tax=Streptomyces sp. V3I8 TaxID=3042279 RepID=UPI0027D76D81|nr:hypothetical protein [Streptomyces sp. V3I8]
MDQRARRVGSIAGVAVAAVMGLAGCSDDADSAADEKSSSSSSPAADAEKADDDASASAQTSAVDRSTAEKAVAGWVAAVIKGEPEEACLLMAEPAAGSEPAKVGDGTTCGDDAPERKQMDKTLGQFKESFTPEPPSDDPKVEVTQAPATGDKVVVPADRITVDGQALDKIVLSHSTGVTQDQLDIKVESSKIEGSWYVTNLDFNIG